mmetsp:Transcript_16721/g.29770  ORF Transcript_16721/g.29770 Transcript_16721/m.29770 type:complete len:262 (+) Transcript_16721:525-1310(+)
MVEPPLTTTQPSMQLGQSRQITLTRKLPKLMMVCHRGQTCKSSSCQVFCGQQFVNRKKRAMSYYYWHADLFADKELTTESKMIYLKAYGNDNQYRYMRPRSFWTLDDTLKEYDLVAVTERLDESLVVLAALLKIPLGDVVYLAASSKSCASGAFKQCHPEIYDEPLEVQEYINNTFPSLNRIDHDLYKKANEMLDAKIASMKLEPVIQQFQKLVADVSDKCSPGADLMLDCYVEDAGCHHECVSSFRASTLEMCEWCDSEM